MPLLRYYNPANPKQQYQTMRVDDPNIPVGYLDTQGSDGATPMALQVYVAGQGSGGFPAYGKAPNITNVPRQPNGILS